jgi:hypothetical protein
VEEPVAPPKSPHLMCGRPILGLAGFALSAYFAYSGLKELRDGDFYWAQGWWVVLTWAVWLVFTAGLLSEVHCWREATFFGVLLLIFITGLVFSAWSSAPYSAARHAREVTLVLWGLAALASLATLPRPAGPGRSNQ